MTVKCDLCRRIKFVLPFSVSLVNVRRSHKPPTLPTYGYPKRRNKLDVTDLPSFPQPLLTSSNHIHLPTLWKKTNSTLSLPFPQKKTMVGRFYWSLVFQLRILYSIILYKKWCWMSIRKKWERVLDSVRYIMESYEGRIGRDLNWTGTE